MLLDEILPYRSAPMSLVHEAFDARAHDTGSSGVTEKEKGRLVHAWHSLSKHVTVLGAVLGQMIKAVKPNATELSKHLGRLGSLKVILLRLARPFITSCSVTTGVSLRGRAPAH